MRSREWRASALSTPKYFPDEDILAVETQITIHEFGCRWRSSFTYVLPSLGEIRPKYVGARRPGRPPRKEPRLCRALPATNPSVLPLFALPTLVNQQLVGGIKHAILHHAINIGGAGDVLDRV